MISRDLARTLIPMPLPLRQIIILILLPQIEMLLLQLRHPRLILHKLKHLLNRIRIGSDIRVGLLKPPPLLLGKFTPTTFEQLTHESRRSLHCDLIKGLDRADIPTSYSLHHIWTRIGCLQRRRHLCSHSSSSIGSEVLHEISGFTYEVP